MKSGKDVFKKERESRNGGLSLRRNFGWNLGGSAVYSLAQWSLLVLLARTADPQVVGEFSLALAISAPIFLTVGLNLRTLQATDAAELWGLREYMALRRLTNAAGLAITIVIGLAVGLRGTHLAILGLVGLAKCVEAVSHSYYGYFMQHERLDLVARSLLARSVTGPALFCLGVLIGGELLYGCAGLVLAWLLPQWLIDRPCAAAVARSGGGLPEARPRINWSHVVALARKGAPLGLDAGLGSLAVNVPRYAVLSLLGAAALGTYAALAYLTQTIQMVTTAMAGALLARLAAYHHAGRRRDFLRLLRRLAGFSLAVMALGSIAAFTLGEPFLRLTLGERYVHQNLLLALMLSACAVTLQRSLARSLEASWRFKTCVVVDVVTIAVIALIAPGFIQAWGLVGAAAALATGFVVGAFVVGAALVSIVRAMPVVPPLVEAPIGVSEEAQV